ncbi:putative serine/arginine-rich splicing factor 33-like isoform 1 [Capsicum annuum]|uniref:UDP-glycosyltransferase 92A1 n=1 Tax=Capsicum annuum TaxID=4072 RepID=UPI001FB0A7CE|nr:UDP-glycosyltransferase 92A1 [Capsicum annuum]KAF3668585.1 putative serine/arginine-rich splicing factor 33-like isoform 1 [Capsicum annuum]
MEGGEKGHIVLFPFMAQGHIIPFLALASKITQKGYQITFINTPLNIKKLKKTNHPSIHFLEIPFDSTQHGLPQDAETNDSLPYNLALKLLEVSPSLEPNFKKILTQLVELKIGFFKKSQPICVISDLFFGWSAKVTHELGILHTIYCGAVGGFGLACYYSMWLNLPHRHTDKLEFILPDFQEAGKFHVTQLSPSLVIADGNDPYSVFQMKNLPLWKNSDGVLFNTIEEFEKNGLMYFRRKLCIPIWAIGPILFQENDNVRSSTSPRKEPGIQFDKCKEWLDSKEKSSVLYICFGSQNTISASQMMQLAKALDVVEVNFIWVIRPPLGFDVNADFKSEEWLPEGFIERNQESEQRGLIVLNWAPQVEILAHESIGGFLSNCGWNSVLESLINGVPLIGWPMAADQFFNAKFLVEEIGVCVEMARGTTFDVSYLDIIEKIELVMDSESEKGKRLRGKACEFKEMIKDATRDDDDYKGSSIRAMDEFFNLLMKER